MKRCVFAGNSRAGEVALNRWSPRKAAARTGAHAEWNRKI